MARTCASGPGANATKAVRLYLATMRWVRPKGGAEHVHVYVLWCSVPSLPTNVYTFSFSRCVERESYYMHMWVQAQICMVASSIRFYYIRLHALLHTVAGSVTCGCGPRSCQTDHGTHVGGRLACRRVAASSRSSCSSMRLKGVQPPILPAVPNDGTGFEGIATLVNLRENNERPTAEQQQAADQPDVAQNTRARSTAR